MIRPHADMQVARVLADSRCAPVSTLPPERDELGLVQLATPDEVARALRVARQTVYAWIRRKKLPAIHLGSGVRVRVADVNRLIEGER